MLHESFERKEDLVGSSDRAFGLTVGGILLAVALWWGWGSGLGPLVVGFGVIGLVLVGFGALSPARLAPLNRLWIRLGIILSKVVSPIAIAIIFVTTIVPIGLVRRALGADPLHLRFEAEAGSYWIEKSPSGPPTSTMTRQF